MSSLPQMSESVPTAGWNIGMLLRAPHREVALRLQAAIVSAGFRDLQPAHHAVLQHLQDEGIRLTEIARRAMLTKSTISQYVAYLEQRGYVRTVPDSTDGRARLVLKTEKGRKVEAVAEEAMWALEREWEQLLGGAGYEQLRGYLAQLARSSSY